MTSIRPKSSRRSVGLHKDSVTTAAKNSAIVLVDTDGSEIPSVRNRSKEDAPVNIGRNSRFSRATARFPDEFPEDFIVRSRKQDGSKRTERTGRAHKMANEHETRRYYSESRQLRDTASNFNHRNNTVDLNYDSSSSEKKAGNVKEKKYYQRQSRQLYNSRHRLRSKSLSPLRNPKIIVNANGDRNVNTESSSDETNYHRKSLKQNSKDPAEYYHVNHQGISRSTSNHSQYGTSTFRHPLTVPRAHLSTATAVRMQHQRRQRLMTKLHEHERRQNMRSSKESMPTTSLPHRRCSKHSSSLGSDVSMHLPQVVHGSHGNGSRMVAVKGSRTPLPKLPRS